MRIHPVLFVFAFFQFAFSFLANAQDREVVIRAIPSGGGSIIVNSVTYNTYPTKVLYPIGTTLNCTAVPNTGYVFYNWHLVWHTPMPTDSSNPMNFTVQQTDTIYAFFFQPVITLDTFDVALDVIPAGSGSITVNSTAYTSLPAVSRQVENTLLDFSATPAPGYKFVRWQTLTHAPLPNDSANPMRFNIGAADSVYAVFEELPTLNVLVDVVPRFSGKVAVNDTVLSVFPARVKLVLDSNVLFSAINDTFTGGLGSKIFVFDHYEFSNHVPIPDNTTPVVFITVKQTDTVKVYFREELPKQDSSFQILMPNAFIPGNEGGCCTTFRPVISAANDIWAEFNMQIFNRWGERVYETNNPDDGWSGNFRNLQCPMGVYTYVLKAESRNGVKVEKGGTVMLIR